MEPERRPTPEEMLERAREEEARDRRGRLKIFFGAYPGAGKTYAMLEAAQARRREGWDVVIGWVETHGRRETEALTGGLERLPPRRVLYRDLQLPEFDADAALARQPRLVLVDELAHTNAPESKHRQRWQDVQDLLDAGIDVYSTLNVQHLESLNDIVAQITRVSVRETVPDSIFERADEVELVDLTAEDLLQRLREGKVYIPAEAERARENFFRKGNLIALRELSLRRTAERVDVQMSAWRRDEGISQPWPTRERILVAIGPAPQSANLIRAACRMAMRLQAPWIALSVETPAFHHLPAEERQRAAAHLSLAERLGAETVVVDAEEAGQAILDLARQRNVTRILVGKPTHPRWRDRLRGSLVDRLVRGSGTIDVLVTTGEAERESPVAARGTAPAVPAREYLWAAATVLASTGACWLARPYLELADVAMIYLLGVLFVSSRFSPLPAVLTSLASVAAFDFFFVPPLFTFSVSAPRHVITFVVMLATGLVVSSLTLRVRRQAEAAREREQRTATLYMMTRTFAFQSSVADLAETAARHVEILFEAEAAVLLAGEDGKLIRRSEAEATFTQSEREMAVANWVQEHGRPAGNGTDTLPSSQGLFLPLGGSRGTMGVLAVGIGKSGSPFSPSQRQLLDVFASQTALVLERALLAEEMERSRVGMETERLRNGLLTSISHDLRTPLAAVSGAVASLLDDEIDLDEPSRRELLETIHEEAERLRRLVHDVLDLTRLESGALQVRKEWCPLEEVIGSALARLEGALRGREVDVDLPGDLLLIPIDAVLIEQVLVNLLENAIQYTPRGSRIEISAKPGTAEVEVRIADRGPGIPAGEEEKIFEKFHRGAAVDQRGTGLGLAVCRAMVQAHGGRIRAENRAGGGAVFRFTLPIEGRPPLLKEVPAAIGPDQPPGVASD
jgi:two-component system sensor histidine kinase KdpD